MDKDYKKRGKWQATVENDKKQNNMFKIKVIAEISGGGIYKHFGRSVQSL